MLLMLSYCQYANEVMGDSKLKRLVQLTGFSVSTGMGNMPHAFVKLNIDGDEHSATDYGVGPVDASLNAIQKDHGIRFQKLGLRIIIWHLYLVAQLHYVK